MRKLLRADFRRLASNKTFGLCLLGMFLISAWVLFDLYRMQIQFPDEKWFVEGDLFSYAPTLGFVIAAVAGMVTGADYADGTIRNKLIAGSERRWVYLSQLVVNCAACLALAAAYVLPVVIVGPAVSDGFEHPGKDALLVAASALGLVGFSAIATALALGIQNRTAAVLTSLAVMTGLFCGASYINARLHEEPTMMPPVTITQGGVEAYIAGDGIGTGVEELPNPYYVSGTRRTVYQWISDINPQGQAIQLADRADPEHLGRWPFTAAAVTLLASGAGYTVFKRKDIK